MTLDEARALHPDCRIIRVRYLAALVPEWPKGFECFLAIPLRVIAEIEAGTRPPPLAPYREGAIIEVREVALNA